MSTAPPEKIMYANTIDAYVTALPPQGRSDHNLVRLNHKYVSLVRRQPVHTRRHRRLLMHIRTASSEQTEMYSV